MTGESPKLQRGYVFSVMRRSDVDAMPRPELRRTRRAPAGDSALHRVPRARIRPGGPPRSASGSVRSLGSAQQREVSGERLAVEAHLERLQPAAHPLGQLRQAWLLGSAGPHDMGSIEPPEAIDMPGERSDGQIRHGACDLARHRLRQLADEGQGKVQIFRPHAPRAGIARVQALRSMVQVRAGRRVGPAGYEAAHGAGAAAFR